MLLEKLQHAVVRSLQRSPLLLSFAMLVYFKALARRNGVRLVKSPRKVSLTKGGAEIVVRCGERDFGATGIVVRDFENFVKSISQGSRSCIDFSEPQFHELADGRRLYFHDICEPLSTSAIYLERAQLQGKGEVVLDLGAYCGTQTLDFCAGVGAGGCVVAVEPNRESFNSLSINVRNSGYRNFTLINKAVLDYNGTVTFQHLGGMASSVAQGTQGGRVAADEREGFSDVNCVTLQALFEELGLSRCDFIKMDIEGSELAVLSSSIGFIQRHKPRFIIEPHKINGVMNTSRIIDFFRSVGYRVELLKQGEQSYQPLLYAESL